MITGIVQAEIALAEAKAEFTRYEIDLRNKPEWYLPKVNPVGKVNHALLVRCTSVLTVLTGARHRLRWSESTCRPAFS